MLLRTTEVIDVKPVLTNISFQELSITITKRRKFRIMFYFYIKQSVTRRKLLINLDDFMSSRTIFARKWLQQLLSVESLCKFSRRYLRVLLKIWCLRPPLKHSHWSKTFSWSFRCLIQFLVLFGSRYWVVAHQSYWTTVEARGVSHWHSTQGLLAVSTGGKLWI